MFESASLDHEIDKATWKEEEQRLRQDLLKAQVDLSRDGRFPVCVVVGGLEGAGRSETVNQLLEWLDPRHVQVHAFGPPSAEERERPTMWRYWRALPPKGRIGVFFGAWHTAPIADRAAGRIDEGELERRLSEVARLERGLADDGMLLLKFWFHLTKKQQKRRLKELRDDPRTAWRVTDEQWEALDHHDDLVPIAERFLRRTSTGHAPWFVVPGADPRYRSLFVGRTLLASLRERLDRPTQPRVDDTPALPEPVDRVTVLSRLDLDAKLPREAYEDELERWQGRLALACRDPRFRRTSVITVFAGPDAAGKGGAIRRVTAALDARQYTGVPVAAPTDEERAQPWLWRFWRHLPESGRLLLFDRSWYGRVLVERVEGFCTESDWMRAYGEINDFEGQLVDHGYVLVKLWLQVSPEEQLRRFREREQTPWKRFKITPEDWRNRDRWEAYQRAVCDMVDRTSTSDAPWTLVAANDKYHARVEVLRTLALAVERGLERGRR